MSQVAGTSAQPHKCSIREDTAGERPFPRAQVRKSIQRHIMPNQPRTSQDNSGILSQEHENVPGTSSTTIEFTAAKKRATPPAPPPIPKRIEREHPFHDGVRDFNTTSDSEVEKVTDNEDDCQEEEGASKDEKVCRCSPMIQKYCLQKGSPFCVCSNDENGPPCCGPVVPKVVSKPSSGVPYGSMLYTHGERSKCRNKEHYCKEHPTSKDGSQQSDKQRKSRGLFSTVKPNEERTSLITTLPPLPGDARKERRSQDNDTVAPEPTGDSQRDNRDGKANQEQDKRVTRDRGNMTGMGSGSGGTRGEGRGMGCCIPWLLLAIIFLWLILLTLYIFNPYPFGLFAGIMSKIEHCKGHLYSGVEP